MYMLLSHAKASASDEGMERGVCLHGEGRDLPILFLLFGFQCMHTFYFKTALNPFTKKLRSK